jgi:hypothetical protein
MPSAFLFEFSSITSSDPASNTTKQMCVIEESNLIFQNSSIARKIQFCTETLLDSIVPCFILVYLDFVILLTLKEASISRSSMRRRNTKYSIKRNESSNGGMQRQQKRIGVCILRLFKREYLKRDHELNEISTVDINDTDKTEGKVKIVIENQTQSCSKPSRVSAKQKLFGKLKTESVDSAFDRLDKESHRTSWLILMVATIISLHEIPLAVYNVYLLVQHAGVSLPLEVYGCSAVILLLWQYVTYLVIFLIYAFMSGAFRTELKRILGKLCGMDPARSEKKQKVFLSPCSVRKTISRDRDATLHQTPESDSETEI